MNGRQPLTSLGFTSSLIILRVIISLHSSTCVSGTMHENQSVGRRKLSPREGFISIDCGTSNFYYTDEETGIDYISDAGFIDTGINYGIKEEYIYEDLQEHLKNVRSFPEGKRNCYTLRPEQGKNHKYLIRARFRYGNYDSKNLLPSFKLYLGADEWTTVTIAAVGDTYRWEVIHVPITDHIDVCLVNTGGGTPFISVLELRQLNDSIYHPSDSGSLLLNDRWDFGTQREESGIIRDRDDVYDRIWRRLTPVSWDSINSSLLSASFSSSEYKLPAIVMSTAATPENGSEPWSINVDFDDDPSRKFYMFMHFAEVLDFRGQIREFTVNINDVQHGSPLAPRYYFSFTFSNQYYVSGSPGQNLSVVLKRTNRSTLPPIINAMEVYEFKEFSQASTQQNNADAIKNIRTEYAVSKIWQGDPCLPVEYPWDGLNCSHDDSPTIIALNLSSSNLSGNILPSFLSLKSLQYLDLSYNNLTGPVPKFFADLTNLTMLNLRGNNLSGSVPQAVLDKFTDGSFGENPNLCLPDSCQGMKEKKKKKNFLILVLVPVLSVIVILIVIAALAVISRKFKRRKTKATTTEVATEFPKLEKQLKSGNCEFTYLEVASITNNFSQVIGRGGFGEVYLGCLGEGTQVAVKVRSKLSMQGPKALQAEAKLLTRVHHKNLVRLIGYCNDGTNMALIYEYMSNGNLQKSIFGRDTVVLSWKRRLQIVLDAAQGLEYLHNGCKPAIVHRDMKSSNILLNETLQAKISDFGMSRYLPTESGALISTTPAGTPGYLDPEFQSTGILNIKSDVYSFGIVLLEVITGRPAIKNPGRIHIVAWVSSMVERGDVRSIVDPRLEGDFSTSSAWKAVEIALECVASTRMERPDMSYVVVELKERLKIEIDSRRISGGHSLGSADFLEGCPLVVDTESVPQAR